MGNIAIDGPAGAGKSTIAKRVAKETGAIYVDTGALYRAIALFMVSNGIDPKNQEEVSKNAGSCEVSLAREGDSQRVILNGKDVTGNLRDEAVGNCASVVSAYPKVRERLLELQRKTARESDVVMDGRDIGTVVLPDADLKIFLTASVETRADRRFKELEEKGENPDMEKIREDIIARDNADMTRKIAPLKQAEDAVLVDSSHMTIDEVTEHICSLYRQRMNR